MKLIDVSMNSLRRRKAKVAFLIAGLVFAVGTVVTLISLADVMNAEIATSLDEFGANILIAPKSDDLSLSYGGLTVSSVFFDASPLAEGDVRLIRTIKNSQNISIIAPKLLSATNLRGKTVLAVGVEFPQEIRLKKWWSIQGRRPAGESEAIVGSDARTLFGLTLNQRFELNGEPFTVAGILEPTGSQDDGIIFIDLRRAQQLFNKPGQLNLVEVAALCYDCPIDEIVRQTSDMLPGAKVTAIRQTIESKMEAMHRFEHFSWGISLVVLMVGGLIVFTSMIASVNQRTREIGIFRAIGLRRSSILRIILMEAFMTSLIAGFLGYLAGTGATRLVAPLLGVLGRSAPMVNPYLLCTSLLLSTLVGLGASIYPAVKASRLDPSAALKAL